VDAVVVVKLDRLFRSLKHLVNTLSEFEALGVKGRVPELVEIVWKSSRVSVT
jgi:DNA invertase Pin-like site-specific DNA recombinase